MARSDTQVNFRIPDELSEQLKAAASINKRSLTAELVARLEQSFKPFGGDLEVVAYALAKLRNELALKISNGDEMETDGMVFTEYGLKALDNQTRQAFIDLSLNHAIKEATLPTIKRGPRKPAKR